MKTPIRNRDGYIFLLILALSLLPLSGSAEDFYSPYVDQTCT